MIGGYRGKLQSSCSKTAFTFYTHLMEIENYFDCGGTVTFILRIANSICLKNKPGGQRQNQRQTSIFSHLLQSSSVVMLSKCAA